MSDLALRVDGLVHAAPGGHFDILRQLSFTVAAGARLSVIGPNGAGKTTLLKCLLRILPAHAGQIDVAGRPLGDYRQRELAQQIAYVPQLEGRFFPYTVREFVTMGRYPYLRPFRAVSREDERAVDEALDRTETMAFVERRLESLSGGERQKVAIAAALAQQARILLLDEPTAFLDYRHQVEVERILRDVNRDTGVTVVTVTHDVNAAVAGSERALALKDGAVAFDGPVGELVRGEVLKTIFGIDFRQAAHPDGGPPLLVPGGRR